MREKFPPNNIPPDNKTDLPELPLDPREIEKRKQELIKMKNLLFYQEQKRMRQNKIKSKKYRKILKKSRENEKLSIEELREINPELAAKEEEKAELKRIKVREQPNYYSICLLSGNFLIIFFLFIFLKFVGFFFSTKFRNV